jgi:signal transduction histidine kinase
MNQLSRPFLARLISALVAFVVVWILVAAWATLPALGLGGLATLALIATLFVDRIIKISQNVTQTVTKITAPRPEIDLGDAATILAGLDDAVLAYDGLFRITFANDAALSLLGLTRDEIKEFIVTPKIAQDSPRFTHLVQIVYPSLAPTVVPRSAHVVDLTFTDPELHLRVNTTELPDHKGFLKVIRDNTRQIEIVHSKGEFVTVASHQLRTPLTEVSWALETLAGSPTLDADNKALATQTLDSVKSLIRTAEDLLGVAKIEEGRFGYRFEATDMTALLDAELAKVLPVVSNAGIKLFFDRPATPLAPVFVDKEKITMVINNLVENAVRYNVKNGEITVRAEQMPDEPFVKVSVQDTGIGIAQADVSKLFTKFFRAENAQKAVAGGTGLGLYIVNNIVRSHGGQLGVNSELGRGSTFYFTVSTDEKRVPQREVAADLA